MDFRQTSHSASAQARYNIPATSPALPPDYTHSPVHNMEWFPVLPHHQLSFQVPAALQ